MTRNRAKCKLCNSVIESMHRHDYVTCTCGEISISGGLDYLHASAKNFDNFFRVDDDDAVINVSYKEDKGEEKQDSQVNKEEDTKDAHKPTREELLTMLDEMLKAYEQLPRNALHAPISHADQLSLLMLISSLFRSM